MELTIKIPQSYGDITLKKWLEVQKELENYKEDEEATTALLLYYLCELDPIYLRNIAIDDYMMLKDELTRVMNPDNLELQKFVTIDGVKYGFEPNLSEMSYGAFVDITKYDTFTIDKNWANIMSILYRPVTKEKNGMYWIEKYTGKIDADKWMNVGMDVHMGALFFFLNLSTDLLKGILKSMKEEDIPLQLKKTLERSGDIIAQSMIWPMGTFSNLPK
jgi:hypothetical protein